MSTTAAAQGAMPRTSFDQWQDPEAPWPYDVVPQNPYENPDAVMWKGDKEYAFVDTEGQVWQGRYPRAMIENAQHTDQPVWLGFDHKGDEVPIIHRELFRGIFVGGQPGTGKTTTGSNILLQLGLLGNGFVFLDPGGEEFFDFLRRAPESMKDRIVPINPQGGWRGKTIKLNYLETFHDPGEAGYEEEVENKVGHALPMIEAEYPLMKGVAENMLRALVQAHKQDDEYDYCLIDFYHALSDTDEYADMVEEQKLTFLHEYAQRIRDEIEDDDLEPLLRRLKQWIESDLIRPLLCSRQSDISIAEAIEDDLCIVVNCDIGNEDARKMLMKAFSTAIWSVIFSRQSSMERRMMELEGVDVPTVGGAPEKSGDLFKPFFFAADEWHSLDSEDTNMGEVLAMARKKRLGVLALTQQLGQLGQKAQKAFKRNTAAKLAFNPGDDQEERRTLAKAFTGKGEEDLNALDRFRAITTVTDSQGQSTPAVEAHMLPEYPYRRGIRGANQWIKDTLAERGSPVQSDEAVLAGGRFGDDLDPAALDEEVPVAPQSDAFQEAVCKAAYDTAIREHGVGHGTDWVDYDAVQAEFEQALGVDCTQAEIARLVTLTSGLSFDDEGETDQLRCTPDGWERFMPEGTDPSEGGAGHQDLLVDLYDGVTAEGLAVEIPNQPGGNESAPDALATVRSAARDSDLIDGLDVAVGDEIVIEAEKSTSEGKAAQAVRNLGGALAEGKPALFIARPETAPKTYNALSAPYANTIQEDGTVQLWNRKRLVIEDDQMLRPAGAKYTTWLEEPGPDGEIILSDSEGRKHARFPDWDAVFEDASRYPARQSQVSSAEIGEDKTWRNVARPFVPSRELPREPEPGDWAVGVAPRDGGVSAYEPEGEEKEEPEPRTDPSGEDGEPEQLTEPETGEDTEEEDDVWEDLEEQFGDST